MSSANKVRWPSVAVLGIVLAALTLIAIIVAAIVAFTRLGDDGDEEGTRLAAPAGQVVWSAF